ncbi:MAG: hypothetical protein ACI4JJ_03150 [Huintestinicola sp.]
MNGEEHELVKLIIDIRRNIECGSKQVFTDLADRISYYSKCGVIYFRYSDINKLAVETFTDFLAAFAARFLDELSCCDNLDLGDYFKTAAIKEIIKGTDTAYTIIDYIIGSQIITVPYSDIIETAVICNNVGVFDRYIERFKQNDFTISLDLADQLFKEKKYFWLDRIFKDVSREKLIELCCQECTSFIEDFYIELMYFIGVNYLPEIRDSDNIPDAASDFLGAAEFYKYLSFYSIKVDNDDRRYLHAWDFMKNHSLKFRNISRLGLTDFKGRSKEQADNREILKKYIMPLLDDEVYIDIVSAANMDGENHLNLVKAARIIGTDRITLDLTDEHIPMREYQNFEGYNQNVPILYMPDLLKLDMKVRIDEDIAHSKIVLSLLKSSDVMEYVLKRTDISDEQLYMLIDICITEGYLSSLNLIRKYISDKRKGE